jgi:hypothetical protein
VESPLPPASKNLHMSGHPSRANLDKSNHR